MVYKGLRSTPPLSTKDSQTVVLLRWCYSAFAGKYAIFSASLTFSWVKRGIGVFGDLFTSVKLRNS